MSKYNFEIELSPNSSTGIILNKINKGSVVLEFGCATGRMTRYMKEVLQCQVYIVEYDKDAYEVALKYAEDGLCDDILNFQWAEKFKERKFDVIIFADVLEHLVSPEKVLKNASGLLKDSGCIYMSVPNITHNDILLKAYEERFDYTSTGLLDDTHVHFWGLKNLEALSGKYGLNIKSIEGAYCPTGYTEQYDGVEHDENLLLENILKERLCGEVYQFIVALDKNNGQDIAHIFRAPSIHSHIYVDTGNDFNTNEIIDIESEYSGQGSYVAHYVIHDAKKIKRLRFDPIENQGCILRRISISQGTEKLPLIYQNAIEVGEALLLLGEDPMVYVETRAKDASIIVDADIVILGETYLKVIQDAYVDKCAEIESFKTEISNTNEKLQEKISSLTKEIEEMRRDIEAYSILANNKDRYSLELEQKLTRYHVWKIEKIHLKIWRCLKGLKRRLKRLVGKD